MKTILDIGTIEYEPSLRDRWVDGQLTGEWAHKYCDFPEFVTFFDSDFDAFVEKHKGFKRARRPYGFFETLAGILLCHATGYRPMDSSHDFQFNDSKARIVEELFTTDVLEVIRDRTKFGATQAPDLLMYKSDLSDCFFCEVKGLTDRLGEKQKKKFEDIAQASRTPIRLLSFREMPPQWSGLVHHAWIPPAIQPL